MKPPQPDPLPRALGRVILRRLSPGDLRAFQAYRHDPQVGRYQGWRPEPDADAARFIAGMSEATLFPRGAWVQLGVAASETNELIGDVGICVAADGETAEIGFTVAAHAQGAGRGADAVRATLALVFDHAPVQRIVAVTDARNTAADRLLQRVGMQQVAAMPAVFRGEACTELVYAIARTEAAPAANDRR